MPGGTWPMFEEGQIAGFNTESHLLPPFKDNNTD